MLEETEGYGADAVFDFVGVQPTVELATKIVAPEGAIRFAGLGGGSFPYTADSHAEALPWGVNIQRSFGGTRADQLQVIALAQGAADRGDGDVPACRLPEAFDDLEANQVRGRAILVP